MFPGTRRTIMLFENETLFLKTNYYRPPCYPPHPCSRTCRERNQSCPQSRQEDEADHQGLKKIEMTASRTGLDGKFSQV